MSTSQAELSGTSTDQDSPDETTYVEVDALITGRKLNHPILDELGVLLLAKGSTITPKFKDLLRTRSISRVVVHRDDAANLTLDQDIVTDTGTSWFDPGLTKQLDNIIESGNLFVANIGKAVSDRMVYVAQLNGPAYSVKWIHYLERKKSGVSLRCRCGFLGFSFQVAS